MNAAPDDADGAAELVEAVRAGDRRALARLLTSVEDGALPVRRALARELAVHAGGARVLGLTGPPGVGKSTLAAGIAASLRRAGRTVAIVAVDPTSAFTGGALLGDRIRMQHLHSDEGVFVRSMATRGHLGGCAAATADAVLAMDVAGFDDVIVETVGVGQSELEVAATADTTIVVLAAGLGDGVQVAKAGILEVADVYVVNKADRAGADELFAQLRAMLEAGHAVAPARGDWTPPVVRTIASQPDGVSALIDALDAHTVHLSDPARAHRRRVQRAANGIRQIASEEVVRQIDGLAGGALLVELAERVVDRATDPYAAADELLAAVRRSGV